jgi:hypothetical protein
MDVETVWERTLNEYERCILCGDVSGAKVMRALILEKLKAAKAPNLGVACGFCGKNPAECECPYPL